jgi:putative ABC transport system ATP-binding protein
VSGQTVTPALRGIDLEINQGELFMLVGPSGCGKTTLISILAGILLQDTGTCTVLGQNFKEMKDSARTAFRGATLGFVFQAYNLIPTLTAVENVSIPLLLLGTPRAEAEARAAAVLAKVGLAGRERSRPAQLSGGQQQRVAIARALVHNPQVIVCDEPTSALDKDAGHNVMELFREVAMDDNRTLVIVTHDNRIFQFADRIAVMSDGKIEQITSDVTNLH